MLPLISLVVISAPQELYASGPVHGESAGMAWEAVSWGHQMKVT